LPHGDFTHFQGEKQHGFPGNISQFYQLCLISTIQTILKMKENLTVVLEQLKTARIQVGRQALRKQINLFDFDDSPEIEFNGHQSTGSLEDYLYCLYAPVKRLVDNLVDQQQKEPHALQKDFDLACFEVKEFRQRYFPKDNTEALLYRVELHKSTPHELTRDEAIKKNPELFFCPV
jgi:hypothetical protein